MNEEDRLREALRQAFIIVDYVARNGILIEHEGRSFSANAVWVAIDAALRDRAELGVVAAGAAGEPDHSPKGKTYMNCPDHPIMQRRDCETCWEYLATELGIVRMENDRLVRLLGEIRALCNTGLMR